MQIARPLSKRTAPYRRGLAILLAGAAMLAAACGGDPASQSKSRSGSGAPLGTAEASTPAAAAAAGTAASPDPSPAGATRPNPASSGGAAAAVVATPHPDTPNPCALVTQAEVDAALGGRAIAGRERRSRDSAEVRCTFDDLGNGRSAVVSVWKGGEARTVYELRREMYGQGATVEEIRELGDRAFGVKGDEGWVNVLRGDVYLSVQVINQTPAAEQGLRGAELRNRTLTLTRAALGRLSGAPSRGATTGAPTATPAARSSPAAAAAAQGQAGSADACRVVTKEELEAALGFALNPGRSGTGPIGDAECAYKAPSDPNPGTMPSVTVSIFRSRLARTTFDTLRESASSRGVDVPGLGDKAYVFVGAGWSDTREILVLKGDVLFSINLTAIINPPVSMSEEEKRTKLIALARSALGRL